MIEHNFLTKSICDLVIRKTGLNIRKKTKKREYFFATMIFYKLAFETKHKLCSKNQLAKEVGRTHATVINALSKFDADILRNPENKELKNIYLKNKKIVSDIVIGYEFNSFSDVLIKKEEEIEILKEKLNEPLIELPKVIQEALSLEDKFPEFEERVTPIIWSIKTARQRIGLKRVS